MKITKELAALNQLSDAIDLFNSKRYLSAITLSAAAEEILSQLLKLHSEKIGIPLSSSEDTTTAMFEMTKDILEIRNYHAFKNKIKNELKHHGEQSNKGILSGNFKKIAKDHIADAIINYKAIHRKLPSEKTITNFCEQIGLS